MQQKWMQTNSKTDASKTYLDIFAFLKFQVSARRLWWQSRVFKRNPFLWSAAVTQTPAYPRNDIPIACLLLMNLQKPNPHKTLTHFSELFDAQFSILNMTIHLLSTYLANISPSQYGT